jgi:hypothetical protein
MREKSGNTASTHDKGAYLNWVRRNQYYVLGIDKAAEPFLTIYDYLLIIRGSRWRTAVAALGITLIFTPSSFISCIIFREPKNELKKKR